MQKTIKILFGTIALFYILGSSYQMYLFLDYQTHKEEITKEFCENTDKPDMHCNGKCHLKKKLSEVPSQIEQTNEKSSKPTYSVVKFDTFNETIYTKLNRYTSIIDVVILVNQKIFLKNLNVQMFIDV